MIIQQLRLLLEKNNGIIHIQRYPPASDPSLKAWNAADEYLIQLCLERDIQLNQCVVLHDLFGYLSCHLNEYHPQTVITFASQQYTIEQNQDKNSCTQIQLTELLGNWNPASVALLRIPKSLELFRLYLSRLSRVLSKDGVVLCGFMTRNFTPTWLKIAEAYFEEVTQTKAQKKARILILKGPKPTSESLIHEFSDDEGTAWKQYLGVFSSGRIDPASRFLMEQLELPKGKFVAIDVGSGNGVLSKFIKSHSHDADIHLADDNVLATLSGEMNVVGDHIFHHFSRDLSFLADDSCDLVVTNPPFHLEYEVNLDVAFQIFKDAERVLKNNGRLWIVANNNLPYKPQLQKHFQECSVMAQNQKFIVYRCVK